MIDLEFIHAMLLVKEVRKPNTGEHFIDSDVPSQFVRLKVPNLSSEAVKVSLSIVESISITTPDDAIILSY